MKMFLINLSLEKKRFRYNLGILPTGEDFLKTSNLMNNDNTSSRVYLVRHGITDWIEQGILQGISDRPLSPFGTEQAELTARAFQGIRAAHLYTSPLLRAMQTAQPIARVTGLTPEAIEGFTEMDYGWMEGKKDVWSLVKQSTFLVQYLPRKPAPGGPASAANRPSKFKARILDAWENLRNGSRGSNLDPGRPFQRAALYPDARIRRERRERPPVLIERLQHQRD